MRNDTFTIVGDFDISLTWVVFAGVFVAAGIGVVVAQQVFSAQTSLLEFGWIGGFLLLVLILLLSPDAANE
jgi:hypothetical protein